MNEKLPKMVLINRNKQELLHYSGYVSAQHPNAKLVLMRCHPCGNGYLAQTCDVHERLCPRCQAGQPANTFEV